MDKDKIIHDLALLHLYKSSENLTPDETIKKYKEAVQTYNEAYNRQPKPKARVLKRSDLGLL